MQPASPASKCYRDKRVGDDQRSYLVAARAMGIPKIDFKWTKITRCLGAHKPWAVAVQCGWIISPRRLRAVRASSRGRTDTCSWTWGARQRERADLYALQGHSAIAAWSFELKWPLQGPAVASSFGQRALLAGWWDQEEILSSLGKSLPCRRNM